MNRFVCVMVLSLGWASAAWAGSPSSPPATALPDRGQLAAKMDEYLKTAVQHDHFSGTVLIAKNGKRIFEKSYGMANYELDTPNTNETAYHILSMTKPFTAISIMMLQEEGALSVNDPICDYLVDCPETWQPVTIHHLLTNTSGIMGYSRLPDWDETLDSRRYWRGSAALLVRDLPLLFRPGEGFHYSNTGYNLLGKIIERASGKTLSEFYQDRILSPLGMDHTGFDISRILVPNLATGYYSLGTQFIGVSPQGLTDAYGSAGIYSTVGDLLIWDQALYSDKLISKATYEQMIAHKENGYAYGWELKDWFGRRQIGHAGSGLGYSNFIVRFIDDRITVIVLSNSDAASATRAARDLSAIYFGEEFAVPTTSALAILLDEIMQNGIDAGLERYRELKDARPSDDGFQDDELLVDMGYDLYGVPMLDKAKRVFEFAIKEFPQSADSYCGLADIAIVKGDYETAIRHFETALAIDSDNDYAVKGLARARERVSG